MRVELTVEERNLLEVAFNGIMEPQFAALKEEEAKLAKQGKKDSVKKSKFKKSIVDEVCILLSEEILTFPQSLKTLHALDKGSPPTTGEGTAFMTNLRAICYMYGPGSYPFIDLFQEYVSGRSR